MYLLAEFFRRSGSTGFRCFGFLGGFGFRVVGALGFWGAGVWGLRA